MICPRSGRSLALRSSWSVRPPDLARGGALVVALRCRSAGCLRLDTNLLLRHDLQSFRTRVHDRLYSATGSRVTLRTYRCPASPWKPFMIASPASAGVE